MTTYTDASSVAAILQLAPDTTLSAAIAVGATTLTLASATTATGISLYPGMLLALDFYNPAVRESVTITGPISGTGPYTVPISATAQAHSAGAPIKEVSALQEVVEPASRMIDDATFSAPGAFAEQTWTETTRGQGTPDGWLFFEVSGRGIQNISAVQWQSAPNGPIITLDPTRCIYDDYRVWAYPASGGTTAGYNGFTPSPYDKQVIVTVTYTAGYNPVPADLGRAATVLAARLYKEGQTGFSDVLGNADMGLLQFKKGIPSDVAVMLKPWRRWS